MDKDEMKRMQKFERTYWWHIGKRKYVKNFLTQYLEKKNYKIFEIGCGVGEITSVLEKHGTVYANDLSKVALEYCKNKGIKNIIHGDINKLDLEKYSGEFDLVIALDVLEHIQEDTKTIERAHKLLKPNGLFLTNVPAYKFLWSGHDEALRHKRRYTSYEIKKKLENQNFNIVKQSYFVFFVFTIIVVFKFLSNFIGKTAYPKSSYVILPNRINSLMVKLLELEIKLIKCVNLPFGTTITTIAKKK